MARRKCRGGCGRWLKSPAAVEIGYGRVCAERLGIPTRQPARPRLRPKAARADPGPEQIPGQVALPLVEHQPTLWSL
ncbi:DUF6011 domain-containing protein [Streptomyces sp. LRE541]|uniref:DUF6011 domain-containing protein n=1 Tax=Streptomyces sp. LRE541 TaxID=2931983 RepID=UPI00200E4941|nr:DUF6011 domain-containing protein [Streptomyces sp. LRE541]UPZ27703.1 DUF6011 domain-containing protein [Streptomyces sp. LRE541]